MERVIHFDYLANQDLIEPMFNCTNGAVGSDTMGCSALIAWLEEQLGIIKFEPEQRLFAFYRILSKHAKTNKAICRSFEKNPIATARVVMSWFDGLTLIGWRGEALKDERLQRFGFLTDLYNEACDTIAGKSDALRIEQCIERLQGCQLQLNRLVLAQPKYLLPNIWQQLFCALVDKNVAMKELPLADSQASNKSNVKLISAGGVIDAADIAAQYVSLNGKSADDILVVSEYGTIIDQALGQYSLPSAGFKTKVDTRLITQIVPAMLNTLSGSYSIECLVTLFKHPLWLGNRAESKTLANKLVSSLGIGNEKWEEAKTDVLQQNPELKEWLAAIEEPEPNAEQIKKAVEGLRLKALKVQKPVYREFARQCNVILDVLTTATTEFSQNQWTKLLKELGVGQMPMMEPLAQVGRTTSCHGVMRPGHLSTSPDITLWVGPYSLPGYTLPDWYQPEFDALSDSYDVFSREHDLKLQRNSWNQFIEQTSKELLIVDFDNEALTHPLFDELSVLHKLTHESWSDYLAKQNSKAVIKDYNTESLYPYARVGRINKALPIASDMSASRLERLIFKPSDFVLNYSTKLRDYDIKLPAVDNRARGIYAHALFEAYFTENPTPDKWIDLESWEEQHHERVFKQRALVFLEPGAHYDLQSVREQAKKALTSLVNTFLQSGVIKVTPELSVKNWPLNLAGRTFKATGSIDLLLEKEDGNVMVLDAKWSNSGDKHKETLEGGCAVQLYTYASIYEQSKKRWPEVGYFIIKDQAFLLRNNDFLQGQGVTQVDFKFSSIAESWQTTNELAAWRFEQLERGEIELNNPGCDEIAGVTYPEDDDLKGIISAYREANSDKERIGDKYSDYRYLLGWPKATAE